LRVLEDIGLRTALALDTAQIFRALEAEQRHRDEFLAMLAHELRNPLAAVSNGLAALERVDAQTRVQLLQILSRQSKHLARLLNDLLDVSGVRFGRVTLERRRLDVRELARQTLDVFEASGKTAKLSVALHLYARPVCVVGDADRLEQVIANLLDNAVKYTPSPGSIDLSVAAEDDDAVVRVRDSGVGIAAEFLPRIFEVFSRGTRDPGQDSPGLGLGLSVVRDLVVKHGGTVSATSAGAGKGSEFVVRLPLAADR
jgi:two-component system, sensor histidine kinase